MKIVKNERDPPLSSADKMSKHSEKHYSCYHTTYGKNPIFHLIKFNNSGTAKVKIVKNERDPPLFKAAQNTQVII